jgi:hemerythrin-like metal-binding protein
MAREYIKWTDRYCIGHTEIDEQHKELVCMLNKLHADLTTADVSRTVAFASAASKAVKYVVVHFDAERKIMVSAEYPGLTS